MSSFRAWLFRGFVIGATGFMLVSWFIPWWRVKIFSDYVAGWVQIRPWTLEVSLGAEAGWVSHYEMPGWFAPLMWAYLGICVALLIFSLFAKEKVFKLGRFKLSLPQLLIGGVGISYIIIVVIAVIYARHQCSTFDYPFNFIGYTKIEVDPAHGGVADAVANLKLGYWLACGAGPLLIILALLRNKIAGKHKANA